MASENKSELYKKKRLLSFEDVKERLHENLDNRKYSELLKYYTDKNFKGSFTRNREL